MKILAIHFKNINSLEGETRINFTQPPISDTGVFAITGANGSGKSSVLDAITLGLYGETFRFDRPASFVMTKHTTECFAEVEFAVSGETYQSSWHVRRAGDDPSGEPESPLMRLVRLQDGAVLASTPSQVCAQIAELTGMTFRNFTRSILLAQGDFAAFLNALDSERMDILEKIISADIYAESKKQILAKADEAQGKLEELQQRLADIALLEPEQLTAYEHDLLDFNEQYAELQEQQKKLRQQQAALTGISDLQYQLDRQQGQLQAANEQLEKIQGKLDQIDAVQDALRFKDDVVAVNDKKQVLAQGKAELAEFQRELEQLKIRLGTQTEAPEKLAGKSLSEQKQAIDELSAKVNFLRSNQQSELQLLQSLGAQISEKKSALATVKAWLEEHAADEALLENFPETGKLKRLRAELAELGEKQKVFAKQTKKSTASLKNNSAALAQANKNVLDLSQQLEADENELVALTKNKTLNEIDALRLEQQERVKAFQELYDLALAHKKLTGEGGGLFSAFKRKPEPVLDADSLTIELDKLTEEIKREENIKRALDQALIYEALLKKMAPDRVHLVDGKPCPLCGALQHPYSKQTPIVTNSVKAVSDQQLKIRALKSSADHIKQQIIASQKNTEKNRAVQLRLQQLRSQWLGLCNKLNAVSAELDINNTKLMQQLLATETEELKEIVALLGKCRAKQAQIAKTKALIAKNQAAVEQLHASAGQLDTSSQEQSQEYQDNAAALALCQQEEQQLAEKIARQLALLGEKMPDKGKEDALFDRLNSRRQDYQGYAFRNKNLAEDLALLATKQANCQTEITRYHELLEIYTGQLQGEESIGLHLALIEKQKLIADKQQQLAQQESEASRLQQALQEQSQATLSELQQRLELIASQSELEQRKLQVEQEIADKTQALEKNNTLLTAELERAGTLLHPEQLEQRLKTVAEKMDLARLEAQRLERLFKEQQRLRQQYESVQDQLQEQQAITEACLAEVALLTAENGMAFRRRVQIRLAEQLLSQTNAVLEKVSGRYYLRHRPSEQGLALEIEDTYQNNVRRQPKTLSGGESFVVSLALALGLSELASNGKSVDSLFLDEGFGNLDAETLYTVISTLEGLQTHGKTVGVISHVEAVQKRIKAQLQVVKKSNGMGELRKAS